MPPPDFASFETDLARLSDKFGKEFKTVSVPAYPEARLRDDYLNPLLRALGWDLENAAALIQSQREVEIESRTDIDGRAKRADYLFRTDGRDRFVCEAKKPFSRLGPPDAFQAKRYAFNMGLPLAVLTDFEEIKVYVVGGRPHLDRPAEGHWKTWHYQQYPLVAEEIWRLLARANVAAGSIDALLDSLPKRASAARGPKARQTYLIRPDRTRSLDADFLNFLDEARHELASSILQHNERADVLADDRLNAAAQHILDRLLFIRICEDRDIDTGTRLASIVEIWRRKFDRPGALPAKQASFLDDPDAAPDAPRALPPESLWSAVVAHFRALDHRPPGNVPFFNGQLFKPHFSEGLLVGDRWLADFIATLSADESPYLFNIIPVEILGSVYERFLGKVIRPHGRGVKTEEKPEVRKAGGVYYTPRYIVDYIVEQTVGRIVGEITAAAPKFAALEKKSRAVRVLDPACGSGSFLIRAFERMCEHWLAWFTAHPEDRKKHLCRVDDKTHDVHLTVELKRQILTDNIFGVDLDAQAVEVTQLSLYLKMLEGETRQTLAREFNLEKVVPALLPPLDANIKWGNSLIASDFSLVAEDLIRVRAFDWPVQFREIMRAGGFDAVIGNPPWGYEFDESQLEYLRNQHGEVIVRMIDSFMYFVHAGLCHLRDNGLFGMIVPDVLLYQSDTEKLRRYLLDKTSILLICNLGDVFEKVTRPACVVACSKSHSNGASVTVCDVTAIPKALKEVRLHDASIYKTFLQERLSEIPGVRFATTDLSGYMLWNRVKQVAHVPLADLVDKDGIQRGVSPDLKDAFLVNSSAAAEHQLESTHLRKTLTGGRQVKRYDIARPDLLLIYTSRDEEFKKLPNICKFIDQFRPRITCKEVVQKKHSLYALHRARDEKIFTKAEKLIGVITEDEIVVALDTEQTFVTDGLYLFAAKANPRYLMGILNSRLFVTLYRLLSMEEGRVLAQVKPTLLTKLPIRVLVSTNAADKKLHDKMVTLVDKMLILAPQLRAEPNDAKRAVLANALAATDHQIDALVYQLYALSPDEIALVEAARP